jgi:hypothetical protein
MATHEQILAEIFRNRKRYIETFIKIEDKNRVIVPFHLNYIQQLYESRATRRDIILKPRQVGFSSYVLADILADTITKPGTVSVIVCYEDFITQRLLQKVDQFYDSIPEAIKPPMGHRSTAEKSFPDIKSVLYIGTARSFVFGRGDAIHNLLCDEYGFWPNPERLMVPLQQAVPKNGRIKILSTPNGPGNSFASIYESAKKGLESGGSIYTPHFFPWYIHHEYQLSPDDEAALPKDRCTPLKNLTTDELILLDKGLTENQIRWRRAKIVELEQLRREQGTGSMFVQEYPEDDVTCFIVGGNLYYDVDVVDQLYQGCKPPLFQKRIEYKLDENDRVTHELMLDVWVPPEEGKTYLLACDPGQGALTYSGASVWQFHRDSQEEEVGIHCATLHGKIRPEHMAPAIAEIGKWYNHAVLAVESNGHGLAVTTNTAVRKYPNLYWRTDILSGKVKQEVGWRTDAKTKPWMLVELRKMMPHLTLMDARIVSEFRNIRADEVGNVVVTGTDDLHDTAAIAMATRQSQPVARGYVGTAGWDDDWGKQDSSFNEIGNGRGYRIA